MTPPYRNPSLSSDDRVTDLLSRMSLEEKVRQLNQPVGFKAWVKREGHIEVSEEFKGMLSGAGVGSLYGVLRADPWSGVTLETGLGVREGAEAMNAIQRFAIENTRWGIPILFGEECSHGHMAIGATVFPAPCCVASTWNPGLLNAMSSVIAHETRAQGGHATYSPIVDVVRDPRWGRAEESWGEDPYLVSRMAEAAVKGLQGDDLSSDKSIIATIKHFVHGTPEGGHNAAPSPIGPRELQEVYLSPFQAAVKAGAKSVMSSYNEIDGVPSTGNRNLLTTILRDEWGFDGFVISDMAAVWLLHGGHHVAADESEAAKMALEAGVDMEMSSSCFAEPLLKAVREGRISEETIDRAAGRILKIKFMLGLFENPYVDQGRAERLVRSRPHRELAREIAREGIVLLKNEGGLLPLKKDLGSIAVIGPNADNIYNQLGDYTAPQPRENIATVFDGIREAVTQGTTVRCARGCGIRDPSTDGFAEAVEAAKASDVAVVVVGGSSARDFGPDTYSELMGAVVVSEPSHSVDMDCGEGLDKADLELSGVQNNLIKAIHATGTPVVLILINGRPVAINWAAGNVPAVVEAWYPGSEGGRAVADVLFGDYNPAGRLAISFPKSAGQIPVHYSAKSNPRQSYIDLDSQPLYPFGLGLSYTTFAYSNLTVTPDRITPDGEAEVSADVTNTGDLAGDEVVQLYIRDEVASVTRPIKLLKGFERIHLAPGETKRVIFRLGACDLALLDANLEWTVEPGWFTITVGGNSTDHITARLGVVPVP